jgi:hypothetical protein
MNTDTIKILLAKEQELLKDLENVRSVIKLLQSENGTNIKTDAYSENSVDYWMV